ncbi:MAG: lamin tail domain-containing protein, partial [Acidimicrobiales bacterium]
MRRIVAALTIAGLTGLLVVAATATPAAAVPGTVVVSQVYGGGGNSGATLTHDFIELFNRTGAPVPLDGWSVQYASATGNFTFVTPLSGSIAPGGYYLVQEAQGAGGTVPLPTPDATGSIAMSATAGKVVLVDNTAALNCGAAATPCPTPLPVEDLVGYGTTANLFEGAPAPGLSNTTAALRDDGGAVDTDNNADDFTAGVPNPRNSGFEPPPPPPTGCDVPPDHEIADVQGSGDASPLAGQTVRVEGIVTGDFQGSTRLNGFFLQDDTPDGDPATSDGVFAFSGPAVDVLVGDRVLVTGRAFEFNGLTELSPVTGIDVCGTGTIAPAQYDLPRPDGTTFEPVEGVLLTFPETLTATEHFQLGRFGEVTVSSDGRLFQPTERFEPGAPAVAEAAAAARRRLLIDDGSTAQNPPTVPFVAPGNALRIGDTASGVTGVLSFGFSRYRLQPTAAITFTRTNPRPP